MLHPLKASATAKKPGNPTYIHEQLGQMTARGFPGDDAHPPLPPVEDWHPAFCGDSNMHIARDGTWFHQGTPIGRRELVRVFSTLLRKDDDGFMLVTPAEKLSIRVEDAPFLVVLMEVAGSGRDQDLSFITNVGDRTIAGADHPLRFVQDGDAPIPYVHVRGRLEAKLARPVYYQLIDLAVEEDGVLGVWSCGRFFALEER